ncbi:hypothetical protein [Idiomarina abyssalis]|uniref:Uncharacterized protein n=1 Tax=Idiomarina abyssalis TaxID=86102 RepID=A0A8I1GDK3_9GAMM|nr:hypothetical protein [Idiomarina abyssalis]MBJ7265529.1 hypothetical protein [Idiomarina abyssalis]MBJ7316797.1 hypothetical protein [Idiomarina abyssalis]
MRHSREKVHTAFPVGMVVSVGKKVMGNPAGSIGVVYENYRIGDTHFGCSIIFENGKYDGFSENCLAIFEVLPARFESPLQNYTFLSVLQLEKDWERGVFDKALIREKRS